MRRTASGRILVIDDDPASLELMTYLLEASGSSVLSAKDGGEGIELARQAAPDVVVCDIHLPGVDGYEVARRLRADPALRRTPLVAVTALAMVGDRDRVLAAGFDGYLDKPITPERFATQVHAFVPRRDAADRQGG